MSVSSVGAVAPPSYVPPAKAPPQVPAAAAVNAHLSHDARRAEFHRKTVTAQPVPSPKTQSGLTQLQLGGL